MIVIGCNKNKDNGLTNQQLIKETNQKRIFSLIYHNNGISRAKLAQRTGLSPTTVSVLVDELIDSGLVITKGAGIKATSGRKPIMLEVNNSKYQIACITWRKSEFQYSLYDLKCKEIESISAPVTQDDDIAQSIYNIVTNQSQKLESHKLLALCISIPAIIDYKTKNIISTVLDIHSDYDFVPEIKRWFPDTPIMIGNESAFYAYGEKEYSSTVPVDNLVYININDGVGAGIVYNGEIFKGSYGTAGEFGHMSIDMNGPQCSCGNKGCIERLINFQAIISRVQQEILAGGYSVVKVYCDGNLDNISFEMICKALDEDDALVAEIIDDIAKKLAFGINNVISIFNPEEVVIGGGMEKLGDKFINNVRKKTKITGFRKLVSDVKIHYTRLQGNAENKGAAKYFIDNIFRPTESINSQTIIC